MNGQPPSSDPALGATSEERVRARIDPVKGELQDFLQHVGIYEEQNLDVESPYFMEQEAL